MNRDNHDADSAQSADHGDNLHNRGGGVGERARDLLTVEQAAAYLLVSVSSIRSYIREGRLKAFRVAGKRKVLIPRAALLALLVPTDAEIDAETPPRVGSPRSQSSSSV